MASFLFPRTITITRPSHQGGAVGKQDYGGQDRDAETTVAVDIMAGVQARGTGRSNPTDLPADPTSYRWVIVIPMGQVPEGDIKNGDYVTDDLGRRFRVAADYNHGLGWSLQAEQMEK